MQVMGPFEMGSENWKGERRRTKRAIPKPLPGTTPLRLNYAINYDETKNKDWVSPSFSSDVFKKSEVTKVR